MEKINRTMSLKFEIDDNWKVPNYDLRIEVSDWDHISLRMIPIGRFEDKYSWVDHHYSIGSTSDYATWLRVNKEHADSMFRAGIWFDPDKLEDLMRGLDVLQELATLLNNNHALAE